MPSRVSVKVIGSLLPLASQNSGFTPTIILPVWHVPGTPPAQGPRAGTAKAGATPGNAPPKILKNCANSGGEFGEVNFTDLSKLMELTEPVQVPTSACAVPSSSATAEVRLSISV